MRRIALVGATLALAALGFSPSYAGATAKYVTANAGVGLILNTPAGLGVGGYIFPASATAPASVRVADASGESVAFTACQEVDGQPGCGSTTADPVARGCSTGNAVTLPGFKPNLETAVFVYAASTRRDGVASTGTITLG